MKDSWSLWEKEIGGQILTVAASEPLCWVEDKMLWTQRTTQGRERVSVRVTRVGRNCSAAERWKSIRAEGIAYVKAGRHAGVCCRQPTARPLGEADGLDT